MTLWSHGLTRWRDKVKPLYCLYHSAYGQETCYDGDLPYNALTHKVARPFGHVFLLDPLANWNHYISITTVPVTAILDTVMTYFEGPL